MRSPVPLPAAFVGRRALRALFAVADRPQAAGRHAQVDQEVLGRRGLPVAQSEVVLVGPALVAVPLDHDAYAGELLENVLQPARVPIICSMDNFAPPTIFLIFLIWANSPAYALA